MSRSRPVLLGPTATGKTTLMPLVAEQLGIPFVDLDDVAEAYYLEVGRGEADLAVKGAELGAWGSYLWWQVGHTHALRRAFADHPDALIALGAGHSVYDDIQLAAEAKEALADCVKVLVLPSPDLELSLAELRARNLAEREYDWVMGDVDVLATWVTGPQNHELADITVYTAGRTPAQTAAEICEKLA